MLVYQGLRIKTEPEIDVIARPSFDIAAMSRFLRRNGFSEARLAAATGTDAEKIVEMATRTCYLSFNTGRNSFDFHKNIIELGHGSTIEHANWTLMIAGVSRSWSHEMVRHRAGFAFSQLSQRYVDESDCAFVMPPAVQQLDRLHQDLWVSHMVTCLDAYKQMIFEFGSRFKDAGMDRTTRRKRAREAARSVLPNAAETILAVTGNARSWRHFIEMRSETFAEPEMRGVAVAVYRALLPEAPYLFGDYTEEIVDGPIPVIRTMNRKV